MDNQNKTALVTGANSGVGLETARKLAKEGYGNIILASRTIEKSKRAQAELIRELGTNPFKVLSLDVSEKQSVLSALDTLVSHEAYIDLLVLNAGMVPAKETVRNSDGIEEAVAVSLVGPHILTIELLERGHLADNAKIIIAGSEAARGDVSMMKLTDISKLADDHLNGDRVKAVELIAKVENPYNYTDGLSHYGMAKVLVSLWAGALARRLPKGTTVYSVSPGNTPATNAMRHQPLPLRFMMGVIMKNIGPFLGVAHSIEKAAERYLDAAKSDEKNSGCFFASAPGKMAGKLTIQTQPHLLDTANQEAVFKAIEIVSGISLETNKQSSQLEVVNG